MKWTVATQTSQMIRGHTDQLMEAVDEARRENLLASLLLIVILCCSTAAVTRALIAPPLQNLSSRKQRALQHGFITAIGLYLLCERHWL